MKANRRDGISFFGSSGESIRMRESNLGEPFRKGISVEFDIPDDGSFDVFLEYDELDSILNFIDSIINKSEPNNG